MSEEAATESAKDDGTVIRVIKLLMCVASSKTDISIKQFSEKLQLPASTVHRLLRILSKDAIIEQDPSTHRYRASSELFRLSSLLSSKSDISILAIPYMQEVVANCDEACMLVRYLPRTHQVEVIGAVNSSNRLRYEIELYRPHSLLWGATGRSILAFLPEQERDAAIRLKSRSPATGAPLPKTQLLIAELNEIRARGYAKTAGQKIEGAVGIGTPIYDSKGRVIASLCVTIPMVRFDPKKETALANLLKSQARQLSASLGYVGEYSGS